MTLPRMDSVWALYALQKSMMLTPCGPSAVPTGGAGVAAPACSCTLTSAAIFFLGGIAGCVLRVVRRGHREPDRLCHLGCRWGVAGSPEGNLFILVAAEPERKSAIRRAGRGDGPRPLGDRGSQTRWTWLKL